MRAFEVYVNGEKVCTAGFPEPGILNATLIANLFTYTEEAGYYDVMIAGMTSDRQMHRGWRPIRVRKGDELTVRFVDAAEIDATEWVDFDRDPPEIPPG